MDWKVFFVYVCIVPWIASLALVPLTGRGQARRWAKNTGLVLDDVRGPMVVAELKNNAVLRRVGGAVGMMGAILVAFRPGSDDSFTTITAAYGLALGGYGLGVVVANAFRRPRTLSAFRLSLYSDADLHERRYERAISSSTRAGAFVLAGTGLISSSAFLIHPNGNDRWPVLVTLVVIPTSLVAFQWVERQRLWGSTEADVDVMASMRTGDIRVLWAICAFFGALATVSGVLDVLLVDDRWWSYFGVVQPFAMLPVIMAASGAKMSSKRRSSQPDLRLPDQTSQTAE